LDNVTVSLIAMEEMRLLVKMTVYSTWQLEAEMESKKVTDGT